MSFLPFAKIVLAAFDGAHMDCSGKLWFQLLMLLE